MRLPLAENEETTLQVPGVRRKQRNRRKNDISDEGSNERRKRSPDNQTEGNFDNIVTAEER
jgi:hypothetical protein